MNKRYWSLLFAERGTFLLGVSLAVITAFSGIALLAVSGWFISAAALAGMSAVTAHTFNFFTPGAIVRGLSIARTAGRYGERLANHEATFRLIASLRSEIFNKLAHRKGVSAVMNRHESASQMMQDIQNIEGIHLHSIVPAITALLSALGFVLVCTLFVPVLGLISLPIMLMALLGIPYLYAKSVLAPESKLHIERNALWSQASGIFSSLRLLTLSQQLTPMGESLREKSKQSDLFELEALKKQQQVTLLSQLVNLCLIGVTLAFSLEAYLSGQLNGALIFMLLLLALGTTEVLAGANAAISHLLLGQRALSRLSEQTEGEIALPEQRTFSVKEGTPTVSMSDLTFTYPSSDTSVIDHLNLTLQTTGLNWIAGQSGKGKTTLLRLIAGELQGFKGAITLATSHHSLGIGYLPQRVQIIRSTLRHNLDFVQQHSDDQLLCALKRVQLDRWVDELPEGLDTWIGPNEWEPSGGELKRLGLARLILSHADIIVLDEPFAGMDHALQQAILTNLREVWADQLVILVSHDLDLRDPSEPLITL